MEFAHSWATRLRASSINANALPSPCCAVRRVPLPAGTTVRVRLIELNGDDLRFDGLEMPRRTTASHLWSAHKQHVVTIDRDHNVMSCNMSCYCPLKSGGG